MLVIKFIFLIMILVASSYIGAIISNKYKDRTIELKEVKKGLNIFETKIKYTYEPVPEIFNEISKNLNENIGNIFKIASSEMKSLSAKLAWEKAVEESKTSMKKEDIDVVKGLGKLLGKTDLEGQVSQIELTNKFLDEQIEIAQKDYLKNEKLYKTLRRSFGLSISNNTYINKGEDYGY
ncbi:MAG: hypothetical protein HFJ57_01965 [Clostridia bacterium]|nr:hypothetical protein [Clostridia bacterium]